MLSRQLRTLISRSVRRSGRSRVNRRHCGLGSETLESRRLLTISLSPEPLINAFVGVGYALNPVTEIQGVFNGVPDKNPADYQVQIDWGDGTSTDTTAKLVATGTGVLVKGSHVYQAPASGPYYSVTVTVTGPHGEQASDATTGVSVVQLPDSASRPPQLPSSYSGGQPLGVVTLGLSPEPVINAFAGVGFALNPVTQINCTYNNAQDNTPSDFHAQINWGDSPQWDSNVGLTSLAVSGVLVKGSHIYQAPGNYHVTLYVTGPDGQTMSSTTTQVYVVLLPDAASRPPQVPRFEPAAQPLAAESLGLSPEPVINAFAGVGFALNPVTQINCTYNNAQDNTPSDFHAQINWGDSPQWDSNVGLTSLAVSGVLVKGSHIYQAPGNYHVTLYVTGPDGQTMSSTTTQVYVVLLPDAASRPPDVPAGYGGALPLAAETISLSPEPVINATAGMAFPLSPLTQINGVYRNSRDTTASDYRAQVNWGDGPDWDTYTTLSSVSNGVLVEGSHEYGEPGMYHVTLYVTGPDGQTESDTTTEVVVEPEPTPTILIAIDDTLNTNDNLTLYNPPASAQPYTQTIPARITNLGSNAATFQLTVMQAGSGNVMLSQTSMQLESGASAEITITPTADSSAVKDVHIIATDDSGTQLAEDDMTVVSVILPNLIFNADTPPAMLAAGAYRIPPRVNTPENIQVTPSLSGSGQSVTLLVANQSAGHGTVTIGGSATQTVTSSGNVQLSSPGGNTQTVPGNAAQLRLALQVRGQNTIQSSHGFSVAAIPQYVEDVLQASLTGTVRGILVANVWKSDSGILGDLSAVTIQEQVQSSSASGIFKGRAFVTSGPLAATLTTPTYPNLGISVDTHSFPISWITRQVYTGKRVAAQTSDFVEQAIGTERAHHRPDGQFGRHHHADGVRRRHQGRPETSHHPRRENHGSGGKNNCQWNRFRPGEDVHATGYDPDRDIRHSECRWNTSAVSTEEAKSREVEGFQAAPLIRGLADGCFGWTANFVEDARNTRGTSARALQSPGDPPARARTSTPRSPARRRLRGSHSRSPSSPSKLTTQSKSSTGG